MKNSRFLLAHVCLAVILTVVLPDRVFAASVPSLADTINPLPGPPCYGPLPIAINNTTKRVYTAGGGNTFGSNGRVSVIDAQTNSVIDAFSLPWGVDTIAINEATNKIYLGTSTGPDGAHLAPEIVVLDGANDQIIGHFSGNLGRDVSIDPVTGRLFAVPVPQPTNVLVYDGTSLALLATIGTNDGTGNVNANLRALNATSRKLYFSGGGTVIGVIDLDSLTTRPFVHTSASQIGNLVADPTTNKLFAAAVIPNGSGGNTPALLVYNSASDVFVTSIPLTPDNFGFAFGTYAVGATLDSTRHRVYFSDDFNVAPSTHVFDTQSNSVVGTFPVPFSFGGVLASSGKLYATQYSSFAVSPFIRENAVGVIDPINGGIQTITTGYRPTSVAVDSGRGRLYVADQQSRDILTVDVASHAILFRTATGVNTRDAIVNDEGFRDIAVCESLNRIYATRTTAADPISGHYGNAVDILNGATGALAGVITVGSDDYNHARLAVDNARHRLFVSARPNTTSQATLNVYNLDNNALVTTIPLPFTASAVAVNPDNARVYVDGGSGFGGNNVVIINSLTNQIVTTLSAGAVPGQIAINRQTNKVYIANAGAGSVDNDVTVINGATDAVETTFNNTNSNNGDAVAGVGTDDITNTVYVSDNSNQFDATGRVTIFNPLQNYQFLGQIELGHYPGRMIFDAATRQMFVTNDGSGYISVLSNGVPPPPPGPAHGGLSTTAFRVNGSKNPSSITADSTLHFSAQQSGAPNDLVVHVQFNTTANNNATDWVDLNNGSAGYMTFDKATQQFVLSSFNYPLTNGIYFRALSKAGGFPDSKSNVVGPFNLTANKPHLSTTTLYLATTGPGAPIKFRSTVGTDQAGITLYIQSTLTPDDDASWVGLTDGRAGQMHPYADPKRFYLDSTNYPAGAVVYFRALAQAVGFADSVSNIIGVKDVVVGTPAVLEITPLTTPVSGNDGSVPASPLVYNFGSIKFNARLDPTVQFTRQIKKISIFYDGAMIESLDGGATSVTAEYTTTVPGDHVIKAVVVDDLGIRGFAPAVYVRIKPPGGKIFTMSNSGNWTTASNWVDEQGQPGVPGAQDLAIVNGKVASIGSDVTTYAISLISGELNGTAGSLSVPGFFSIAAGALKNVNLFIKQSATMSIVGDLDIPISGTVTNNGTIRINGLGGIAPVLTGARSAVGSPDGFFDGIGAFFKNAGDFIFHRVNVKPKVTPPPAQPPVVPQPRLVAAEKFTNTGRLLSENGLGLIAPNGAALIAPNGASLIGNDGAGLITNDGGSVISNDGASLIGNDGAGLITNDGGSRPAALSPDGESLADTAAAPGFTQSGGETDLNGMELVSSVTLKGGTLSGTGVIAGSLTNESGYVSPGHSTGRITVTGNFQQTANGTLIIEDGGLGLNQSDHLAVGGIATLGGNLHVRTIDGYHPAASDQFNPLSYDSVVGNFASAGGNATLTLNTTGAVAAINPSAAQPTYGQPQNISTRLRVLTSDKVLIGGFIVSGAPGTTKAVLIRGKGPSLSAAGLSGVLADPLLELHKPGGTVTNDNWADAPNKERIPAGFAPTSPKESIIIADLAPGNYTVIEKGAHGETGIGLTEIYDLDGSKTVALGNISTRGFVDTGDNVMIGGFIVGGTEPASILVRATGPSLAQPPANLSGVLLDPVLELHDSHGNVLSNDNWRETQESEIIATTVQPANNKEPAILATLVPGNYTAIVRGKNNTTGIAVVEAYKVK